MLWSSTMSLRKYNGLLLLAILLAVLFQPVSISRANTGATSPSVTIKAPVLIVLKQANVTKVQPGEPVQITVNVTNVGNYTATNIQIEDPVFSDWAVKQTTYQASLVIEMNSSASFAYSMVIVPQLEGDFVIRETTVHYEDVNGSRYTAYSNTIDLSVKTAVELQQEEKDWGSFYWLLLVAVLPSGSFVLVLKVINYFKHRKPSKK